MKNLIKLAAAACLVAVLTACSSSGPSMSDRDSADYGPPPTAAQIREGVRALGGDVARFDTENRRDAGHRLSMGWATDLDNPGGYIYGWQVRFQQDAANGGGTVTALFHDGILVAATRDTASQAKPERLK
ncbi:hypothetical protein AKI39_12680 [Bordetella sp. H567]|uniref:hypothetical protein n=1 Tax=Bordetella sp. H567 TaxID=1697043 RepID=UPI00081D00F8|nr:hypothetical protein [Bordetella sp. H567]AOB31356.1 hypothetical protein AKI39_12680 [Bordetella sp. H567]